MELERWAEEGIWAVEVGIHNVTSVSGTELK